MSFVDKLVTDRTRADVQRLTALNKIGWQNMTDDERGEWLLGRLEILRDGDGEQLFDAESVELLVREGIQKGAYNASDLNRVNRAVDYLVDRLAVYGYSVSIIPARPRQDRDDWLDTDIPTRTDLQQYLANISAVRAVFSVDAPLTPLGMDNLTYEEANDIEKILIAVEELMNRIIATFVYCGQPFCGQIWEGFA